MTTRLVTARVADGPLTAGGRLMRGGVRLRCAGGVELFAAWAWAPALALVAWSLARDWFPHTEEQLSAGADDGLGVVGAIALLGSVALRELARSRRARREGLPVRDVRLRALGGAARLASLVPSPGVEARVALAGPLASLAVGIPLVALAVLAPLGPAVGGLLGWLGGANLLIAAANLLPGLPMDGGRLVRALVWRRRGDLAAATAVAAALGAVVGGALLAAAVALVALGAPVPGLWAAALGAFAVAASRVEARTVALRSAVRGLRARDAMTWVTDDAPAPAPRPAVDPDADLATSLAAALQAGARTVAVARGGRVLGVLDVLGVCGQMRSGRWPRDETT